MVAEAPGANEVHEGRPLVGRSGQEVMRALNAAGKGRVDATYANALLCQPPDNDWKLFHYRHVEKPNGRIARENSQIRKQNKERKAAGLSPIPLKPEIPTPIDCCKPQLDKQLRRAPNVLALGVTAYYAITGKRKSIRKIRGSFNDYWLMQSLETGQQYSVPATEGWKPGQPVALHGSDVRFEGHLRIIPTLHPAFVLRAPAWRPVFQGDVARFFRWMRGELRWNPPRVVIAPDVEWLRQFLYRQDLEFHTVDCETDGLNVLDLGWTSAEQEEGLRWANATLAERRGPWRPEFSATPQQRAKTPLPHVAHMRCLQIGALDGTCVVVPIRSIDGRGGMERWYPAGRGELIVQLLKGWLTDPSRTKVGHNHLYFDNRQIETEFGIQVQNCIDTMVLFRGAASELRRDLYTLGTYLTDVPDWKTGGDDRNVSVKPRSDHELHVYGATDVHVTAQVFPPLLNLVQQRGQMLAMEVDHRMVHIAREMYSLGLGRVNETKRATMEADMVAKVANFRKEIADVVGDPKWNVRSMADMTTLFVEDWGLPVLEVTATGEPSWDDATLRAYRQAKVLDDRQLKLVDLIRAFRTVDKQLGTYVRPWRRWNDYRRSSSGKLVGGKVGPDGRLHAQFNVTAPKTGRVSSSDPNCFDGETELLTLECGWVRFSELALRPDRDTLHVAQWSSEGGVEFVRPTAWQHHRHEGPMIELKNQQIDLLVTPDHRCLLEHRRTGEGRVFPAQDYPEDWRQLHAGHWRGGPGLDCDVPLLLAVQADGALTPTASGKWDLVFMFRKARKAQKLRGVLTAAGVAYTETQRNRGFAFYVHRGQEPVARVAELLGAEKAFGPWLLQMSRAQADVFCDDIFCWDGSPDRRSMYSSSTPGNASWAATILSLSGHRTKVREYTPPSGRPNWQTDCTWGTDASLTTNIQRTEVPWNGSVYCVSVPSSYVLVRRNGRTCVTGQCQNVIEFIRALVEPEDGHIFVGADYDQIELRIVAALASLSGYLGVFAQDGDPHAVTSLLIYAKVFEECLAVMLDRRPGTATDGQRSQWEKFKNTGVPEKPTDEREAALKFDATDPEKSFQRTARYLREHDGLSWSSEEEARKHVAAVHRLSKLYKQLRVFAKTFVYAVIYGGTANTVYQSVSAAEDPKTGKLLFPDMTLEDVRVSYNSFMRSAPELKLWWEQTWEFARRHGYVTEPITGYRRDFPEFERNEILNLPVQGSAAKIMSLGMIRLRERIAPGGMGPRTGIVAQVHDFAMAEVPAERGDETCESVQSALTMRFPQLRGLLFPASAKKAANWMAA